MTVKWQKKSLTSQNLSRFHIKFSLCILCNGKEHHIEVKYCTVTSTFCCSFLPKTTETVNEDQYRVNVASVE